VNIQRVDLHLVTDVSLETIGPVFKSQTVFDRWTVEDCTHRWLVVTGASGQTIGPIAICLRLLELSRRDRLFVPNRQ